ncbi:MAG: efflux RND transporter periplasmic adaptor subunit, partial [Nitrospiria bacterium]
MDSQTTDLSRLKIVRKDTGLASSPHPWPRKIIWTVIVVCILVAVGVALRFLAPFAQTVEETTVSLVSPSQALTLLNASGYVVAQRRAAVASKGTGRLVDLRVREGDRVKKGQILARLESADVAAALSRTQANLNVALSAYDQAKAELKDATFSYERKTNLLQSGLVPQAEFDAVEARYHHAQAAIASAEASIRAAEASVRAAQVDIENTYIRAPFDGTVLAKNAEVGEVVAPFGSSALAKAAVVTIADMTSLQVEADVSESNIEKITLGQRCDISLDAYPETRHEGIVDTIVPTADRAK